MATAWAVVILAGGAAWILKDLPGTMAASLSFLGDLVRPGPHFAGNAVSVVRAAAVTLGLLWVSDLAGLALGGWWLGRRPTGAIRCAMPLAGYFACSTALLGLAATGLWSPGVLAGFAVLVVAAGMRSWRNAAGDWSAGAAGSWRVLPPVARLPAGLALVFGVILTAPPETGFDALTYHLAFPDQVLVTRRLFGADGYSHWLIPLPMELPHAYALLCGAETAARWTGLVLLIAGGLAAARVLGAGAAAPWLAAGAALVPGQRWILLTAKNDAPAVGLVLAAAALLVAGGPLRRGPPRRGIVVLGGALLGAAVAAKYLLLPVAAILGLAAWWRSRAADRGVVAVLLAAGVAVPLAPWFAKGWCYLADPVYPMGSAYLPAWFDAPGSPAIRRALLEQAVRDPAHAVVVPGMALRLLTGDLPMALAGLPWMGAALAPGGTALAATGVTAVVAATGLLRGDLATIGRYALPVLVLVNLAGAVALWRLGGRAARVAWCACVGAAMIRLPAGDPTGRPGVFASGALDAAAYRAACLAPRAGLDAGLRAIPRGSSGTILAVAEPMLVGLPRRVRMQVFEPPLAWTASHDAPDWRRIAARFHQSGVRWILYNQPLARLDATSRRPYAWTVPQVRRYADFVARHVRVVAFCGVAVPGWGSAWLLEVAGRPHPPADRFPFLPGAESAFASPVLSEDNFNDRQAAGWWRGWRGIVPEASWLDARLGAALLRTGRPGEAYPLLHRAAADGFVDETNLLDLAVAAHRTGRGAQARTALDRAGRVVAGWPDRLGAVKHEIMGQP